jgi:hypothetical protein
MPQESPERRSLIRNKSIRRRSGDYEVDGDYQVGKGRPPLETRWKPGQSGNPRGRPKGSRNIATMLNEALNQKITVRDKGKTYKITAWEGIARRLALEAVKGNLKAVELLLAKEPEIARKNNPIVITSDTSALEWPRLYQRIMQGEEFVFRD